MEIVAVAVVDVAADVEVEVVVAGNVDLNY